MCSTTIDWLLKSILSCVVVSSFRSLLFTYDYFDFLLFLIILFVLLVSLKIYYMLRFLFRKQEDDVGITNNALNVEDELSRRYNMYTPEPTSLHSVEISRYNDRSLNRNTKDSSKPK